MNDFYDNDQYYEVTENRRYSAREDMHVDQIDIVDFNEGVSQWPTIEIT